MHIRSHVDVDTEIGLRNVEGVMTARSRLRDLVSIQVVAFPQSGVVTRPGTADLLEQAVKDGAELIGGVDPSGIDGDPAGQLDAVFGIAGRHGVGDDEAGGRGEAERAQPAEAVRLAAHLGARGVERREPVHAARLASGERGEGGWLRPGLEPDRQTLLEGARLLAARDRDLARLLHRIGQPPLWGRRPGFQALIRIILEQATVPVIVDAGVGTASDAAVAMEMGCDGVLMNTAIAGAKDPALMAEAMRLGVEAGRKAFLAGRIPKKLYATASSPLEGILN